MAGQLISNSGNGMQTVAQGLLVLKITRSGTALGLVTALQFAPMLVLAPFGGVIADRVAKRSALYATQTVSAVLALMLGVLVLSEAIELWMVYLLAGGLGLVNSLDHPVRQTFMYEVVGPEELPNAVSLNAVMASISRVLGPAIAGTLVAVAGLGTCFLVNAGSFVAVILALLLMRTDALHPGRVSAAGPGQLREVLRHIWGVPELRIPLLMLAVIGMLAWQFPVILPLMARFSFHGGAGIYSAMSSIMGIGAIVGGLTVARFKRPTGTILVVGSFLFGASILLAAAAPNVTLALVAMIPVGGAGMGLVAMLQASLQLHTPPEMRGRVMGLFAMALLGMAPIGGPIIGWVGEHIGPRYGLAVGGVATILSALVAYPKLMGAGRRVVAAGLDEVGLTAGGTVP